MLTLRSKSLGHSNPLRHRVRQLCQCVDLVLHLGGRLVLWAAHAQRHGGRGRGWVPSNAAEKVYFAIVRSFPLSPLRRCRMSVTRARVKYPAGALQDVRENTRPSAVGELCRTGQDGAAKPWVRGHVYHAVIRLCVAARVHPHSAGAAHAWTRSAGTIASPSVQRIPLSGSNA